MLSFAAPFLENYDTKRKFTYLACSYNFSSNQNWTLVLSTI